MRNYLDPDVYYRLFCLNYAKKPSIMCILLYLDRRPRQWHSRGRRFDPAYLHHRSLENHLFSRLFAVLLTNQMVEIRGFEPLSFPYAISHLNAICLSMPFACDFVCLSIAWAFLNDLIEQKCSHAPGSIAKQIQPGERSAHQNG